MSPPIQTFAVSQCCSVSTRLARQCRLSSPCGSVPPALSEHLGPGLRAAPGGPAGRTLAPPCVRQVTADLLSTLFEGITFCSDLLVRGVLFPELVLRTNLAFLGRLNPLGQGVQSFFVLEWIWSVPFISACVCVRKRACTGPLPSALAPALAWQLGAPPLFPVGGASSCRPVFQWQTCSEKITFLFSFSLGLGGEV